MEELTSQLAGSFSVSNDPNSTAAAHPRFSQYKSRNRIDQETRRKRILEEQKKQRFDYLSHVRNLSEGVWDNTDAESVDSQESMDIQVTDDSVQLRRPGKHYRNQLMYSEWLVEVPEDFEQEWLMVICPVGKRCLVVATRGHTTAYAKSGYQINQFQSTFPGGNKDNFKDNAILDCIFNEVDGIYYILDIMCWKNHPIYDSETEFRFFWLNSKISETPEVMTKSDKNPYRFLPLPSSPCTKEAIGAAMSSASYEIDGLLFYHKRTHYTFGSTPLVVWLKPYMLPEILGITVPEKLAAKKPDNYTTYAAHMDLVAKEKEKKEADIKAKKEARKKEQSEKGEKMEVSGQKGKKKKGKKNRQQQGYDYGYQQGYDYGYHQDYGYQEGYGYQQGYGYQDYYGYDDYNYGDQNEEGEEMELMMSEWMTALPENFETDWFMIACPIGKRQMVLSGKGTTCSQNKAGMVMDGFRSHLPGGNPSNGKGSCILDCIYSKKDNTFFIIDVMFWKEKDLRTCDADFRYYWLKNRIDEERYPLDKITKLNEHKFVIVNDVPCTKKAMEVEMSTVPYQIDGLLFYKRSSFYTNGVTEDCLWLKPHMLKDLIGEDIEVPIFQMTRRPQNFSFEQHVEKVKKERTERKDKSKPKWVRKPRANIDQLVDEIAQIYIEKRGGAVPEGVKVNPVMSKGKGGSESGAYGPGKMKGSKGKQPLIRPATFVPGQMQKKGNYVGSEDFQIDGETFAHMGGYREMTGGLGISNMPGGEYVAHSGGYRKTMKGQSIYEPSGVGYPEQYNYGMIKSAEQVPRKGRGRGMLGIQYMNLPQYNMWGYSDVKQKKGRGGLMSEYTKTHHQFK